MRKAAPVPAPPPKPKPKPPPPAPEPSPTRVHYPPHRAAPPRQAASSAPSPLIFVLLIAVPAIAAVAALRPR
ncbi:hypothetical protein GCM10010378_40540 [Streptomyces viridochromogenes]